MFDIGLPEFMVLALVALFVFGPDRLPSVARQAARSLRKIRKMASSAQRDFKRELGPEFEDFELDDLNPRNFVKKHVLNGVEDEIDDVRKELSFSDDDLLADSDEDDRPNRTNGHSVDADHASLDGTGASRSRRTGVLEAGERPPFDPEAT